MSDHDVSIDLDGADNLETTSCKKSDQQTDSSSKLTDIDKYFMKLIVDVCSKDTEIANKARQELNKNYINGVDKTQSFCSELIEFYEREALNDNDWALNYMSVIYLNELGDIKYDKPLGYHYLLSAVVKRNSYATLNLAHHLSKDNSYANDSIQKLKKEKLIPDDVFHGQCTETLLWLAIKFDKTNVDAYVRLNKIYTSAHQYDYQIKEKRAALISSVESALTMPELADNIPLIEILGDSYIRACMIAKGPLESYDYKKPSPTSSIAKIKEYIKQYEESVGQYKIHYDNLIAFYVNLIKKGYIMMATKLVDIYESCAIPSTTFSDLLDSCKSVLALLRGVVEEFGIEDDDEEYMTTTNYIFNKITNLEIMKNKAERLGFIV